LNFLTINAGALIERALPNLKSTSQPKNPEARASGLFLNLNLKLKLRIPPTVQGQQPDRPRDQ
jgi:hypothetical protein